MEKFKEKRIVNVLANVGIGMFVGWLLCLIGAAFYTPLLICFLLLPLATIPLGISALLSKRNAYTREFLLYMQKKIDSATTKEEFRKIEDEFISLAVEGRGYCLSFPANIRAMHKNIQESYFLLKKIEDNKKA